MKKNKATRRGFIKASAATAAVGYLGSGTPTSASTKLSRSRSPLEEPGIAFIGTGIRFHTYHGREALKFGPCISICDVDTVQAGRALQLAINLHREHKRGIAIKVYEDYRKVLDNKDVDIVVIGTVDHWHSKIAIDAMRAGNCLLYTSPSPRDRQRSRMPSSA